MTEPRLHSEDQRPAANQFSLRGMFLFMTATCAILAFLALGIKSPVHWLGVLVIPLICLIIIVALELVRKVSSPPLQHRFLPPPSDFIRNASFSAGENPFAPSISTGDSPFGPANAAGNTDAPSDAEP